VACGGNSGVERETRLRMTSSVMHVFNNGSWWQKPFVQGSDEHLAAVWETVTEGYSIVYTWHQQIVGINSVKCLMEIRHQGEPKGLHYPDWMRQTVITDWLILTPYLLVGITFRHTFSLNQPLITYKPLHLEYQFQIHRVEADCLLYSMQVYQDPSSFWSRSRSKGGRISKSRPDILQEIEDKDRRRQAFWLDKKALSRSDWSRKVDPTQRG
jgi:hypothetical protein